MKNQTKEKQWVNEQGMTVPAERIAKSEKIAEKAAYSIAAKALRLNEELKALKQLMSDTSDQVMTQVRAEANMLGKNSAQGKGNLTWFNFDRSIKVECRTHDRITFDDKLITLCQEKLNEFLNRALHGSETAEMVRQLVHDAFNTSRGKLDSKKVMSLLKYESKIDSKLYKDAMELLKQSIERPGSRVYYTVSLKKESGEYEVVNLNISSL